MNKTAGTADVPSTGRIGKLSRHARVRVEPGQGIARPLRTHEGVNDTSGASVLAGGERSPGAMAPSYAAVAVCIGGLPTVSGALAAHPRTNPATERGATPAVAILPNCAGSAFLRQLAPAVLNEFRRGLFGKNYGRSIAMD